MRKSNGSMVDDVVKPAIAGFAGTMAMGQVTRVWYQHEEPESRQRYQEVTGGEYTPQRTATRIEETLDLDLSKKQQRIMAKVSHQAVGIGARAAYTLARRKIAGVDAGQGLLFGALFSLVFDETLDTGDSLFAVLRTPGLERETR